MFYESWKLILKTEKKLWPSAQAENCRLALGLKRLDTPGLEPVLWLVFRIIELVYGTVESVYETKELGCVKL